MYRTSSKSCQSVPAELAEKMHLRAVRSASHHCPDIVSPALASALNWFAEDYRTKDAAILMSLMGLTATLSAGQFALKTHKDVEHHVTPALLMLTVGTPGSGKSVAIEKFCMQPLSTIGALAQRKFFGRPANTSSFRSLIKETNGKCSIIGDEFNRVLMDLTGAPGGQESIALINQGWSGGRITATYVKATSFDIPDSCITCYGTIHPPTMANLLRIWNGGEGLKERWLYSAIADDTVDARTNLLHKLNKSAVPFDVEATFTAFYQYCREQVDMANIVLSPEALERYLELSQEIDQMKKRRRENILGRNAAYTIPASSKEEEMTLKVTLVLHLLENAIISFTASGIIDIPEEVTLETIERAIRYVRTSNNVLRTFNNENIAATKEAEMLLIPGKLLIPQIVSEATRGKNRYSFAEPKMFIKLAKDLERQGLGQIRDVQYRKNENSAVRTAIVYFKSPPSDTLAVILGTHGVTVADYAEAYDAEYNLRPSLKDNLGHIARILEQQNPFSSVTDEHDTENEGSVFSANGENESEYNEDANSGGSVGSDEMVVNGNAVVVNGDSESDVVDVTDGKPEDYQEEEDEDSDSEADGVYQQQTKKQKFAPTA